MPPKQKTPPPATSPHLRDDIDRDLDHWDKATAGETEDVRRQKLHDLILEREAQAQARGLWIREEVDKED
jgi:hypothetical protein